MTFVFVKLIVEVVLLVVVLSIATSYRCKRDESSRDGVHFGFDGKGVRNSFC